LQPREHLIALHLLGHRSQDDPAKAICFRILHKILAESCTSGMPAFDLRERPAFDLARYLLVQEGEIKTPLPSCMEPMFADRHRQAELLAHPLELRVRIFLG